MQTLIDEKRTERFKHRMKRRLIGAPLMVLQFEVVQTWEDMRGETDRVTVWRDARPDDYCDAIYGEDARDEVKMDKGGAFGAVADEEDY